MPTNFTVERHADVPLEFAGTILADLTTREDESQTHWTELRLFKTDSGKYVVESVGCTTVPGQHPLIKVDVCDDARAVRFALTRHDKGRKYMTDLALEAIDVAAQIEPALKDALTERI